jgi:cyclopropane-fatty-acyl-phospholipid synthase
VTAAVSPTQAQAQASTPTSDYAGASVAAIQHHYDLSNDFFALWLDPSRTYSCALWDGQNLSLDAAQVRKLDYHAVAAAAPGATRVLDIGCGWGAMLRRLIEHHGVGHGTGLTLSDAQAEYVRGWVDERYDIRVENWADHTPDAPDDAIISGRSNTSPTSGCARPTGWRRTGRSSTGAANGSRPAAGCRSRPSPRATTSGSTGR